MIVGLTGYARSGKDTVGQILVDRHIFRRVAFGDTLKRIAEDMNPILDLDPQPDMTPMRSSVNELLDIFGDWEKVKDEFPVARQYLVDLGNSLRKRIPGVEVAAAFAGVDWETDNVVATNVYHREEIEEIQSKGGYVWRIVRPGGVAANADEARTGEVDVDFTLLNNGSLDDLELKVAKAVRYFNY